MTSFQRADAPITSITIDEYSTLKEKQKATEPQTMGIPLPQAVTRHTLSAAEVIQQVDQKFILIVVPLPQGCDETGGGKGLIVLVDQHAADERIKFEQLCRDLCTRSSTSLSRPLIFEIDETEARLLEEQSAYFQAWCLNYNLIQNTQDAYGSYKRQLWMVEVTTLPSLIAERCRAEPKLIVDLMRRELWSDRTHNRSLFSSTKPDTRSWWSGITDCPVGMVEMLKSRSCRTAIMFNDSLNNAQCRELVQHLAQCSFPFQCAHGRPTLNVLARLGDVDSIVRNNTMDADASDIAFGYGSAWRGWISQTEGAFWK